MPQTRYLEIERSLRGRSERGELRPGDRVPSENELARSFEGAFDAEAGDADVVGPGGGARVEFYGEPDKCAAYGEAVGVAVDVCARGVAEARKRGIDTVILDTAGRLHVNDELMGELAKINTRLTPHQVFLVVDAMTGQDAVNSAKAFHERLTVDGVILTKFDSDTRGGAALSVKSVTGKPIRFVGLGEKMDAIETFEPERIAGRILGMGDIVSLVEKAQETLEIEQAERMMKRFQKGQFNLNDMRSQLEQMQKMGGMEGMMSMLPGAAKMSKQMEQAGLDDSVVTRQLALLQSMPKKERAHPK